MSILSPLPALLAPAVAAAKSGATPRGGALPDEADPTLVDDFAAHFYLDATVPLPDPQVEETVAVGADLSLEAADADAQRGPLSIDAANVVEAAQNQYVASALPLLWPDDIGADIGEAGGEISRALTAQGQIALPSGRGDPSISVPRVTLGVSDGIAPSLDGADRADPIQMAMQIDHPVFDLGEAAALARSDERDLGNKPVQHHEITLPEQMRPTRAALGPDLPEETGDTVQAKTSPSDLQPSKDGAGQGRAPSLPNLPQNMNIHVQTTSQNNAALGAANRAAPAAMSGVEALVALRFSSGALVEAVPAAPAQNLSLSHTPVVAQSPFVARQVETSVTAQAVDAADGIDPEGDMTKQAAFTVRGTGAGGLGAGHSNAWQGQGFTGQMPNASALTQTAAPPLADFTEQFESFIEPSEVLPWRDNGLPQNVQGHAVGRAAAVATTLPQHVSHQLVEALQKMQTATTEIQLSPEELGHLRISLQTDGDRVLVLIHAERGETLDMMRRHAEHLAEDLHMAGFGHLEFSFGSAGAAEDQSGGQDGGGPDEANDALEPRQMTGARAANTIPENGTSRQGHSLDLRL